jgi:acyl carrier protein
MGLKAKIIEKIAELGELEVVEVLEDRPLKDLGIDSLMTIELVVFIERAIQRQFPEEKIGNIRTCGDIFREVETLLGSPA